MKNITVIFALIIPSIALAADIAGIINGIASVMNLVIPLLASVAFAASLYGIIRFIASANSEEKRSEAKKYILYGLIGMFVIVAFWGILTIVANTFFGDSLGSPISIPEINLPNPSPSPSPTPTPTPSPTPNPNPFPIPPPTPTPNPNPTPCTPKTYQELCQQIKAQCGIHEITDDNCGNSISISCGFCDYPQVCSASGQCGGGVAPIPPLTNGIVLDWNVNHVVEQFAPNETKTFIARIVTEPAGSPATMFQLSFITMGLTIIDGSFTVPLKPDGSSYTTTMGGNKITGLQASNGGGIILNVGYGKLVQDPYIYPGDFIFTLTADEQGGWGYMSTSIYYSTSPNPPVSGSVLRWNMISTDPDAKIYFNAGETKTFIARNANQSYGFDVIFYPMTDFNVNAKMQFPLKPDGTKYSFPAGVEARLTSSGLSASYDGSINFTIRTGTVILDSYVYPGDFIITMTADKSGWGYMNTELFP